MMNKRTYNVLALVLLLSCDNSERSQIQLPNGEFIEKTTVQEIEKQRKVHYEQYYGFVLEYKDSLFKNALLMLPDNANVVGADVLSNYKINKLKSRAFEAIKFTYILSDSSTKRDFKFENIIKRKYNNFDEELKFQNGFELKRNGKSYVKVKINAIAIPNYSVIVYPKR